MWKAKDAAIYLVIALTTRGSTQKLGATQTNSLINLMDFYASSVLPELQNASSGQAPLDRLELPTRCPAVAAAGTLPHRRAAS